MKPQGPQYTRRKRMTIPTTQVGKRMTTQYISFINKSSIMIIIIFTKIFKNNKK
jgi:hypothetical protein